MIRSEGEMLGILQANLSLEFFREILGMYPKP